MLDLRQVIDQGENASLEFKAADVHADSIANECVAFLNTRGGTILIGVADDKTIEGVDLTIT
jgi:ATP-dependent DNA helicase RecG